MKFDEKGQATLWGTIETAVKKKVLPSWNNQVTSGWSLAQAREWLEKKLEDGADCPCCGQRAQIYRRKLNSGMARALILIWKEAQRQIDLGALLEDAWVDIRKINVRGGDYAKLAYWGLIEPHSEHDDVKYSGLWRITKRGSDFVLRSAVVPDAVYVYNGSLLDMYDSKLTNIKDALGSKFNFEELLSANWPDRSEK